MKIHRFIGRIEDREISRQIQDVLKLKAGERIVLSDGKGHDELVEITSLGKEIKYKIVEKLQPVHPEREIHLYLAILKKENFELAVQKAVECGVSKIVPVITERTIKTGLNTTRLEKIIIEASEQCGRSIVPLLSPILNFKDAVSSAEGEKIIFHLGAKDYAPKSTSPVSIFVGPEGGFTEGEINLAKDAGLALASLGPLTLRGETAAIVGTYRAVQGI
jgi:16S rRNA (uracil1498-N3)-methyltransferase